MKELQEKHRITVAFACKEAQRLAELGFEFGEQELLRKKLIARNDNNVYVNNLDDQSRRDSY